MSSLHIKHAKKMNYWLVRAKVVSKDNLKNLPWSVTIATISKSLTHP
jgi:hypothetical protein